MCVLGISHSGFKHKEAGTRGKTSFCNVLECRRGAGTVGEVEGLVLDRVTESSPKLADGRIDYRAADGGW